MLIISTSITNVLLCLAAGSSMLKLLLSFAVGSLLGDVFLHLLPEAWATVNTGKHACIIIPSRLYLGRPLLGLHDLYGCVINSFSSTIHRYSHLSARNQVKEV